MDAPPPTNQPLSPAIVAAAALRDELAQVYGEDCIQRLQKLAGNPCPRCGREILFQGTRLLCSGNLERFTPCAYGWVNPDGAEAEILGNGSQ